jgi:hypothetical protein
VPDVRLCGNEYLRIKALYISAAEWTLQDSLLWKKWMVDHGLFPSLIANVPPERIIITLLFPQYSKSGLAALKKREACSYVK